MSCSIVAGSPPARAPAQPGRADARSVRRTAPSSSSAAARWGRRSIREFIKAAGGPNALIIDVPTAGGDSVYTQDAPGTRGWKKAGAKNIYVLHTNDQKLADSDSFAAILKKAGGVWFEGGRQFHLVDSYAGTKTETGVS